MEETHASIEVGTHTARLLIARTTGPGRPLQTLATARRYTRLGSDFRYGRIGAVAVETTVGALRDFREPIAGFGASTIVSVATGVVREAENREEFLSQLEKRTGLAVVLITPEREALLAAKGICGSFNPQDTRTSLFDLGGGSTEFILGYPDTPSIVSIPWGALKLTRKFLKSDPPGQDELHGLSDFMEHTMKKAFRNASTTTGSNRIIGTGGTVTSLGAVATETPVENISPEIIHGMILEYPLIEKIFTATAELSLEERQKITGLDTGRAEVIIAGALAVIKILRTFKSRALTVSMSGILEGLLLETLEGERRDD